MLQLTLRSEFRGPRLGGTAIELENTRNTGATQMAAADFLELTYPSADALQSLEAVGPDLLAGDQIAGTRAVGAYLREASVLPIEARRRVARLQPPRRLRALPLHRLPPARRVSPEDHDADGGRFHPAHAPPRPPARLPPHSLLQLPRQSHPAAEAHRSAGRAATDYRDRYEALTGRSLRRCPRCDDGNMLVVDHLAGKCVSPAILDSS